MRVSCNAGSAALAIVAAVAALCLPLAAAGQGEAGVARQRHALHRRMPESASVLDEATEKVTGTIPYKSGMPRARRCRSTGRRFYTVDAQIEKVEIIDIASRKTIDTSR